MKVVHNFLLKKITSTGVGGPAKFFVKVKNEKELIEAIEWAKAQKLKWLVVGDGTNLIPSDRGFEGLIIQNKIEDFKINGRLIYIGAGNNLFSTIKRLNLLSLGGLDKMAGIPGTVGGAIYGCAGAYGQEIKDCLVRIRIIPAVGKNVWKSNFQTSTRGEWLANEQCWFGYRDSIFKKHPEWIIVGAEFKLVKGDPETLKKVSAEIVKIRSHKYPPGLKCPGSFFKNIVIACVRPPMLRKKFLAKIDQSKINHGKIPAAHLLELIGAKGMKRGGIAVADHHANLIYNIGNGESRDIQALAALLKKRVKKRFGIELEEEIRYLD